MNARTQDLIHELRRHECDNVAVEGHYGSTKKMARPHASDEVGVHIMEKNADISRVTRSKNVQEMWTRRS